MPLHFPGRRVSWSASVGVLQLLAVLGLAAALAAMTVPGPASDVTGVAAILALGSLALLAGHTWGAVIVTAADVLLVGKLWPAVFIAPHSAGLSSAVALALALPGLILFALSLRHTVEVVLDRQGGHRLAEAALGVSAVAYLAAPLLPLG